MIGPFLVSLLALFQGSDEDPLLRPAEIVADELTVEAEVVRTPTIDERHELHGRAYRVRVEKEGTYHVDLRAYAFDSYLVLRDADGAVLAEDDDGLVGTHARIVTKLEAGREYRVWACALGIDRGPFELVLRAGAPAERLGAERAAAVLDDARGRVEAIGEAEGERSLKFAGALRMLGNVLRREGHLAAAEEQLTASVALHEEGAGTDSIVAARAWSGLGYLYMTSSEYDQALELFERALAVYEEQPEGLEIGHSSIVGNIGLVLWYSGDGHAAKPWLERSIELRESVDVPDEALIARGLNNLGALLWNLGDYAAARPLLERALEVRERVFGPRDPRTAATMQTLAELLWSLNDRPAASALFEEALAIREEVLGPEHPDTLDSMNDYAFLLSRGGAPDRAREIYEHVLATREATLPPYHSSVAVTLNDLAFHLTWVGDRAAAVPLYERALSIYERTAGPRHRHTATTVENLALLHRDLGDLERARALMERSVSINLDVLGPEHPSTAMSVSNLALLVWSQGDLRGAWELTGEHQERRRARARALLGELSEAESFRYLATMQHEVEFRLSLGAALDEPKVRSAAYELLIDWKGQVARHLLASHERLFADGTEEQRALLAELREAQRLLARAALASDVPDREEHEVRVEALRMERNALEVRLQRLSEEGEASAPSFAELRAALPSDGAVLDFFVHRVFAPAAEGAGGSGRWQPHRVSAWVVRPGYEAPRLIDLGDAQTLELAVRAHLKDVVGKPNAVDDPATALHARLWAPLAEHLAGAATIFVSPDSFLGGLPLETVALEDGTYLIERHAFAYLTDLSVLTRAAPDVPEAEHRSLLAVGGVDFDLRTATVDASSPAGTSRLRGAMARTWGALPATEVEAQVVRGLWTKVFGEDAPQLVLGGEAATEERLCVELQRHSVVHLATHGFFQPEGLPSLWDEARSAGSLTPTRLGQSSTSVAGRHPGLLSGLVCAGANARGDEGLDDGYLTAEELGWLDLSGVGLVVLSACETGLGRARSGEGLISLRRAFLTAGARTVVSSLWSVDDESTLELMASFYRGLWQDGLGPLEALRAAQLAMLARNRAAYDEAAPATWGAFVLEGSWR